MSFTFDLMNFEKRWSFDFVIAMVSVKLLSWLKYPQLQQFQWFFQFFSYHFNSIAFKTCLAAVCLKFTALALRRTVRTGLTLDVFTAQSPHNTVPRYFELSHQENFVETTPLTQTSQTFEFKTKTELRRGTCGDSFLFDSSYTRVCLQFEPHCLTSNWFVNALARDSTKFSFSSSLFVFAGLFSFLFFASRE